MTEEEAKTKWCPFARTVASWPDGPTGTRNRLVEAKDNEATVYAQTLVGCSCIGSACMAWRWLAQTQAIDGSWNVHETDEWKGYRSEAKEGFCGLAGKP